MIQITVKADILPNMHDQLRSVANILQKEYAPNEPGCIQYESYIDGDVFITLEKWRSQDDLDVHLQSSHVAQYVPELKRCVKDGQFFVEFVYDGRLEKAIF